MGKKNKKFNETHIPNSRRPIAEVMGTQIRSLTYEETQQLARLSEPQRRQVFADATKLAREMAQQVSTAQAVKEAGLDYQSVLLNGWAQMRATASARLVGAHVDPDPPRPYEQPDTIGRPITFV